MKRGIFDAYVAGEAGAYFNAHFADSNCWERARRVARPLDPTLASTLELQNSRYPPSQERERRLRALREGAAAVVTGQQVGLFLGPLYSVYKAASTIRLARWLEEQWRAPVVPIFWLQTEDHDAAEIATCHLARGADEPLTLSIDVADDAVPVAHRVLPPAVDDLLAKLTHELARLPHGEEHIDLLRRHYRPGAGWGQAFAGVLAELFAGDGLVLVNPRDPGLSALAAPVHRRALTAARPIAQALAERARSLESDGWRAAVHVREDAPLSFFHPDGDEGSRRRLVPAGDGYAEVDGHAPRTVGQLLDILDRRPAAFSTSALLRPILQDTWLPTAAYVGGPGEVAYFAQLSPVYELFQVPMPIIVPRARFRLIDPATHRALARLGLTAVQACLSFEAALAAAARPGGTSGGAFGDGASGDEVARRVIEGIDRALADVAPLVCDAGERAERSLAKTRGSMARAAEKLGRGYDRARLLRDQDLAGDLRGVQTRLLPRGIPQERFFGFSAFAARVGQRTFIDRVLAAAEPLRTGIEDLNL